MFTQSHFLRCHARTPAPAVQSVEAAAAFQEDGNLHFAYRLRGDMARLFIALGTAGEQKDGLWEQTCFEAFIRWQGQSAYREFNFSPAGQWAIYDFSAYRQRVESVGTLIAPKITMRLTDGHLALYAQVEPSALPHDKTDVLEIGLCAVVETVAVTSDGHSFWALHHPSERPDFHHSDGFSLQLIREA